MQLIQYHVQYSSFSVLVESKKESALNPWALLSYGQVENPCWLCWGSLTSCIQVQESLPMQISTSKQTKDNKST